MHVILLEVLVNRGSVQYVMEIGIFSPAQVLCKLNVNAITALNVNAAIYNSSLRT